MYTRFFQYFLASGDTLRVYEGRRLLFASKKDGMVPLLEYLARFPQRQRVTIFDRIAGNAAALLAVKARCKEVCSPLGSQFALKTLERYGIKYHLTEVIPYIKRPGSEEMCPMERLAIGKEPEEFYEALNKQLSAKGGQ